MQQLGHPHACTNLLLPGGATSSPRRCIPWLHLKYSAEEVFRGGGEEPNLSIGVESIEVGALWWEVLINVGVVATVVQVGRGSKPRSKIQFSIKLKNRSYTEGDCGVCSGTYEHCLINYCSGTPL